MRMQPPPPHPAAQGDGQRPEPRIDMGPRTSYTTKRAALPHYLALREKYLQRAQGRERELLDRTFTTLIQRIERMPDDVLLRISVDIQRCAGPEATMPPGGAPAQPADRWNIAIRVRAYSDQAG